MRPMHLFFVGFALAGTTAALADQPAKKILLIGHAKDGHPYRTHEYMPGCEVLAKCLRQTPGVTTVISEDWPADPAMAEGVASIVLYVPWGANVLFDGPQRERVKSLLNSGVGLAALHWATGANGAEYGQLWLDQMGAWFHTDFSKLAHIERKLHLVDPASPIGRGVQDFTMFDEYYYQIRFAEGARPLITTELDGKTETIAWTFERPNSRDGRSFSCDAGHYHKNFGNDLFRRFVINGILWTAHVEIPPGGAPARIAPADLEVPDPAAR